MRRAFVDDSPSSRCVGGMCRAFVDDSPSSRCVGGPSRAPSSRPSSCAPRSSAIHRRRDASVRCVARSSTIHRRRDALAVHLVPRRRDGRIGGLLLSSCTAASASGRGRVGGKRIGGWTREGAGPEAGGGGFGISSSLSSLSSDGWRKPKQEGRMTGWRILAVFVAASSLSSS